MVLKILFVTFDSVGLRFAKKKFVERIYIIVDA